MSGFHYAGLDYSSNAAPGVHQPTSLDSAARTAQLVAMFAQLGDYGQRVTLAQMAAMLRVQSGK